MDGWRAAVKLKYWFIFSHVQFLVICTSEHKNINIRLFKEIFNN
jgi:hypothetical protein